MQETIESAPSSELAPSRSTSAVSVIVPVFNEVESLRDLHVELTAMLDGFAPDYEILFIDDGSTDGSGKALLKIAATDDRVRVFRFRSNRGKADALNLGFQEASSPVVVTMDADLQDLPSEVPRMVAALERADLVSGWKKDRQDPIGKTFPSRVFNWLVRRISGLPLHDFNCGLKAYRQEVVKELDLYGEMHRFVPVLAAYRGFEVAEIPVAHAPRRTGHSKYGPSRFFKGLYDLVTVVLLTRFENRPMHFFGSIGALLGGIGFLVLCYMSYLRLVEHATIGNRPLLLLGILLLLAGLQLASAGLIGELVVRRTRGRSLSEPPRLTGRGEPEPKPEEPL